MFALKQASLCGLFTLWTGFVVFGRDSGPDIAALLDPYNVSWDVPGPASAQSMPLGNGDIALNVWGEPDGDLGFFFSKTDAWSEEEGYSYGLMKLAGAHLAISPSPLPGGTFLQVLKLHDGEIQVREGAPGQGVLVRIWVDANHPVIRIEAKSGQPVTLTLKLDDWRLPPITEGEGHLSADTLLTDQPNRIAWYHRDRSDGDPHVANLTFGAVIKGDGLVSKDASTLQSAIPALSQVISVYPLTATTDTAEHWLDQLNAQIKDIDALNLEQLRLAHQKWWDDFWHRSWIFVRGDTEAATVTRGYVLQRFITACAGRGAYPVMFLGSLFLVDDPSFDRGKDKPPGVTADYRSWGAHYWMQNSRAIYWPLLQTGDFDMMLPFFRMYAGMLPGNEAQVKKFYGHGGAYFAEESKFWGGLSDAGPSVPEGFTTHYFTPILELTMMMLDYYEYTGDKKFARETLVPIATDGLLFFDQHFGRDAQGKLLLDPDNANEMYWKVHDPAPDIAGLRAILPRLIALPDDVVDPSTRAAWKKMMPELPSLPVGKTKKGYDVLLPYTGPQTAQRHNDENPALYAIYPFRLYGLDKPDFPLALSSFVHRQVKDHRGNWVQDPMEAAMVGLTGVAKDDLLFNFTSVDPRQKFPAFWNGNNSYPPGQENGGNGENTLQLMLMQTDGRKILLMPAWPKGWDADFKLHAPYQTTVQGKIVEGKLTDLVVDPPERKADVVDMSAFPPPSIEDAGLPDSGTPGAGVASILSPQDAISALQDTTKGGPNVLMKENGDETAAKAIDGNLDSKFFNHVKDAANPPGIDSGFVVTPAQGTSVVTGIQFATANDMPQRDPFSITVEGSNDSNAALAGGNGFTLLYEGRCGLEKDPGREKWGEAVAFKNNTAYMTYRILITDSRGDVSDAIQYSEVKLGAFVPPQ